MDNGANRRATIVLNHHYTYQYMYASHCKIPLHITYTSTAESEYEITVRPAIFLLIK